MIIQNVEDLDDGGCLITFEVDEEEKLFLVGEGVVSSLTRGIFRVTNHDIIDALKEKYGEPHPMMGEFDDE